MEATNVKKTKKKNHKENIKKKTKNKNIHIERYTYIHRMNATIENQHRKRSDRRKGGGD